MDDKMRLTDAHNRSGDEMENDSSPSEPEGGEGALSDRLDSWKDIAAYLKRDVSTVQRWERREALPIHRHRHDKLGSVYAYRSEIDAWRRSRRLRVEAQAERGRAPTADDERSAQRPVFDAGSISLEPAVRAQPAWQARRPGRFVVAISLTAFLAGAVIYGWHLSRAATAAPADITSLVVLPLENLSADPAQEYFAAGMTEELIGALAQLRALRVVSRTSAMQLRGSGRSLPTIARELNVDGALEGSIQRMGDRVRIRLQLLHARSDTLLWTRDYERQTSDLLSLQNDVARTVAEEIRIRITPEERARLARAGVVNPAAHEEYLLGRYLLWKFIEEDRARAVEHFQRAIQIDPTYAAAYAGLAHAWWMQGVFGPLSKKEVAPQARAAAQKALALDNRLAEAYSAQAYVQGIFEWNWTEAEKTIRHAIDIEPNSVDAHYVYALLLMALGRFPEATSRIQQAARLDPLSAQVQSTYGRILYRGRQFEEAALRLRRAVELEPRNESAHIRLGHVLEQLGNYSDALESLERAAAASGWKRGQDSASVARVYARMGRQKEARQMLERLGNRAPVVFAALGDKDTAFALLFANLDERANVFIKGDPRFDILHSDPRWEQLLRRMNLPIDAPRLGAQPAVTP
jgi:TolB-like protein/Tfp pilus assembly protein PilF